jgi:hypothetical protein
MMIIIKLFPIGDLQTLPALMANLADYHMVKAPSIQLYTLRVL